MTTTGPRTTLSRRTVLSGLAGGAGGAALLAGCGRDEATTPRTPPVEGVGVARYHYGRDPSQYADLRKPTRQPLGTVVLLHGGYWLPSYGADQLDPLAEQLTGLGYATWNVEYRRTSIGGGFPTTFTDVATAIDHLAQMGMSDHVALVGHSAGGHLAAWAASRTARTPGGPPRFSPYGVISLSGVLDLTRAATAPGSSGPVTALMGGPPARLRAEYALADPSLLVPATCPVYAVQALEDQVVTEEQATSYVAKARAAHGRASLVHVPGDHYTLIDPVAAPAATLERLLAHVLRVGGPQAK